MLIEERHEQILKSLERDGKVIIAELADELTISVDTLRRDLMTLENKGLLKRTRGGAIPPTKIGKKFPRNYTVRDIKEINPYYDAIAKTASTYIKENENIYLSGTSMDYLMIRHLPTDINYTVITNSVIIADELKSFENIDLYITCGKVRGRGSMNDSLVIDFIKGLKIDKAFISGAVISANFGLSNTTLETSLLQKTIMEVSKKSICLIPNNKLGVEAFSKICDVEKINTIITDIESPEDEVEKIKKLGVKVVIANPIIY